MNINIHTYLRLQYVSHKPVFFYTLIRFQNKFHFIGERIFGPMLKTALWWLDWFRLPPEDLVVKVTGLDHNATVHYDKFGVPHVHAFTRRDMFRAFGFAHARDRLFQMEMSRRVSQGRLSEILGEAALNVDRMFRIYGFRRMAEEDLKHMHPEFYSVMSSYLSGVNLFISQYDSYFPIEFTLLGIKPEPWTPIDVLSFARLMIWQLGFGDLTELTRSQLGQVLDAELLHDFETRVNAQFYSNKTHYDVDVNLLHDMLTQFVSPGGSNAYAVSGKYTKSGKPIAANDPHLQLTTPSIWYQADLRTESYTEPYHVAGVSMPGLPFVLIGHNDFISWGCVLSMVDIKDHFIEKFNWNDTTYEYKGQMLKPQIHEEEILIKGSDPVVEKVYETIHGPIVSRITKSFSTIQTADGYHLETSYHTLAFRKHITAYTGIYRWNTAQTFEDFVKAIQLVDVVTLGVVFGATDGNFGYFVTGDLPIRKAGDGKIPREGWTGEYDWDGTIPFEKRPYSLNPERGFVVAANNRLVDLDYPYYIGESFAVEWRALRITERLEELFKTGKKLTAQDIAVLHEDTIDMNAYAFKQLYLNYLDTTSFDLSPLETQALEFLKAWDGDMTIHTHGGSVAQVLIIESLKILLQSRLDNKLTSHLLGTTETIVVASEFNSHSQFNLVKLLHNETNLWWKRCGGRNQVLYDALKNSVEWFTTKIGPDPISWNWGNLHRVTWSHVFSAGRSDRLLGQAFSVGPFSSPGSIHTPFQASYVLNDANKRYDLNAAGVSYKQVVDLGAMDESLWLHGPGQSGRLSSKHHEDLAPYWLNGKHIPMMWDKERIIESSESKIEFVKATA